MKSVSSSSGSRVPTENRAGGRSWELGVERRDVRIGE